MGGADWQLSYPVSVHRLDDHCSPADDRILFDPFCRGQQHRCCDVLALDAWHGGEAGILNAWAGFAFGMAGWGFILFEIFAGEAGQVAQSGNKVNQYVQASFGTMRFIVTVGWSIYPLGYFFGYLMGGVDDNALNLVYNLADFVNKIAFCLAIWQ